MALNKIGRIGESVFNGSFESINFFSKKNLLDFDLILINLSHVFLEFNSKIRKNTNHYDEIDTEISKRRNDFSRFLAHEGKLILFLNISPFALELSNPSLLEYFQDFNLNLFSIFGLNSTDFKLEEISGSVYSDLGALKKLNDQFNFKYDYKFEKFAGKPILSTQKGSYVVGVKCDVENGQIFILPNFTTHVDMDIILKETQTKSALEELLKNSKDIKEIKIKTPDWLKDFEIKGEDEFLTLGKKLANKQKELDIEILENNSKLDEYFKLKQLVFSGDDTLEVLIKEVFENFGFNVKVPEGNKDDLIIDEEDFTAVVEIKGLKHSGSTKNAMQVEKWVTNYALDNESDPPKGILIINAFKELAPANRTENPFPPDMLKYSELRNHCLMLTLDLLNIIVDFKKGLLNKNEIQELLKNTVGVLKYEPKT